jgi:hypothetical protein
MIKIEKCDKFFNEEFVDVGVSTGEHSTYNNCTFILFSNKFVSKNMISMKNLKKKLKKSIKKK